MHDIPEADWRRFRQLAKVALERYCRRILAEVTALTGREGESAHDRYRSLWKLLQERDRDMAAAFDDLRRSRALHQLDAMIELELLQPEEVAVFSEEVRKTLADFATLRDRLARDRGERGRG